MSDGLPANHSEHLDDPARWLDSLLRGAGISRAQAARMVGRTREVVTRWANGREKIPRRVLREFAHLLAPKDESYVGLLADSVDEKAHLLSEVAEFARRHSVDARQLEESILDQAASYTRRALTRDSQVADFIAVTSAGSFALRAVSNYLTGIDSALIGRHNLQRHLRFPSNLAVGALLQVHPAIERQALREVLLGDLRKTLDTKPASPAEGLVRHHALHMLGRYGEPRDRAIVRFELDEGLSRDDPLARKLGYCGLMMAQEGGAEFADQFLYYLGRDKFLAGADLAFDATHYGDLSLDVDGSLRRPTGELSKLAENIGRHFLEPVRYRSIAEADAHRLIDILDLGGWNAIGGRTAVMLQACLEADLLPTNTHEGRLLRRRLQSVLGDRGVSSAVVVRVVSTSDAESALESRLPGFRPINIGSQGSATGEQIIQIAVMSGGAVNTGDTYNNSGSQIAAQGRKARATKISQDQSNQTLAVDLQVLENELRTLRERMSAIAESGVEYRAVADVVEAIDAIEVSDQKRLTERLKAAGKFALETAKEIGSSVAAEAIKKSMGL